MTYWIVDQLFKWEKLRLVIFDQVRFYDRVTKIVDNYNGENPTNKYWRENGLWYGWSYNEAFNRYYFYDQGKASISDLMDSEGIL
jgi:hypothetical protein